MMNRISTLRAAAILALTGALALAGCGGGGSSGQTVLPTTTSPGTPTQSSSRNNAILTLSGLPARTSSNSARTAVNPLSSSKKPQYFDATTANSVVVVGVTPEDPAEAAQYGNLTVCYPLYVGGVLTATPPGLTLGPGAGQVTIGFPAPPGTDGFQITQYAGTCVSGNQFALPVEPVGTANGGVLSQSPVVFATITAGGSAATNQINNLVANCIQPATPPVAGAGFTCAPNPGGIAGPIVASVAISAIQFGALPIANPVREQGAFLLANGKVGVPIPLEAINAASVVVPGLTTPGNPIGGSGPLPSGVTVTSNDLTTHTALFLVDATNGAIAQAAASNAAGLSIHEFNALSDNTIPSLHNICNASGVASCNDITFGGSAAVGGDPWVIVMTSDGVDASKFTSVTITATATIPPATTPTVITTTIAPQSAIYSAGGTGYADAATPAAPLAMIQPVAAGSVYFTDGNTVKIDGTATVSPATGTTLTGLAYAAGPVQLYAVDNAAVGTANTAPSGLYNFNPATLAVLPVVTQDGNGNAVQFKAPVGAVYAADTSGNSKLFVIDGNGIEIVDINQANQTATNVGPLLCTGTLLAAAPAGVKLFGTAAVSTASSTFLVADPGNTRIAQVTVTSNFNCTITPYATGAAFTGLSSLGAGGSLYATSTTGQIYYISASGATPVSLGFTTGTAVDGPLGQIASFTPATAPTLTPSNYKLQVQTGSFFDSANPFAAATGAAYTALAAPFTVAPFVGGATPKAFAAPVAVGVGLLADTSAGAATGPGVIKATGGIVLVPTTAVAAATVTPDSILFVDTAGAGGKLRTIVR